MTYDYRITQLVEVPHTARFSSQKFYETAEEAMEDEACDEWESDFGTTENGEVIHFQRDDEVIVDE